MSSDGERIPKPSKRRRLLLSDSESSDESIINTNSRRRVSRVVSDAESSDEDSDIPRPVNKRKNHRLLSENESSYGSSESDASGSNFIESDSSSDWQSDWESTDEVEEDGAATACPKSAEKGKKSKKHSEKIQTASTSVAGFESDASDGQSEKCPICLLSFRNQEIATPSSCEHSFCLECIEEWSKNVNNCPVDRKNFTVIHVRSKLGGKIIRHVPVETKQTLEEIIQEDPTYCEVCHECDREDRMLLCDGCDLGYHLECLNPPMVEVPMDEWFCPDCAQNSQNDAEAVDIDLDELPDLMEEARRLGLSYGRSRSGQPQNTASPRIIPRTRQTERVRANIRAGRDLNRSRVTRERETRETRRFDPDQPSTSSGIESIGENSRSRSPDVNAPSTSSGRTTTARRVTTKRKTSRATTKRKSKKRSAKPRKSTILREVRITEINNDGEEEEIITYVKVAATSTRRKKKYRRRKKRKSKRARTVSSVANASKTAKRRLATVLKMNKPIRGVPILVPTMKNVQPIPERSQLISARYSAGISQVSLFGRNLGLDYSPPGSDDEFDSTVGHGPAIVARSRGPISTTRRRMALKGIANPVPRIEQTSSANLLDSILNSQELWHSKKSSEVTLRANGTLVLANNDAENNHNINNNESPIKKKPDSDAQNQLPSNDQPLDLNNVNPNDITQAPMYNSSRGGGNRGNFRGGYRDNNRQSHGGQGYSGRDSYSGGGGRRSFGGSSGRDRDFGPPANYSANFEHRAPGIFGTPPLRNRNPQQFRNERNRYSLPEQPPFREGIDRPPFPFPENFQRGPPPGIPPLIPPGPMGMPMGPNDQPMINQEEFPGGMPGPQSQGNFESQGTFESQSSEPSMSKPDEECDIYGDMEGPNKHTEGENQNESMNNSSTLLPPPEPPSGLLDFDENSRSEKDNDSDQELVIDDAPKDDSVRAGKNDDKYDPFNAEESDSNDSSPRKGNADKEPCPMDLPPLEPPPSLENFSGLNILNNDDDFQEPIKSTIRLTAYDDDDDEDSQADCPNFSIYSSETMDVARNSEQELSSQIGPLEPPPLPPDIPDMPEDDDVIVGDVQACDLADIPEPSTPYVEALQKERQTINNFPSKKISANDSRGKITFKINKFKLNSKFGNLYDEMDKEIENSIEQEKELEESREMIEQENIEAEKKNDSNDVSDIEDVPEPKKSKKRKRKRDKKKARRNSEDSDIDLGERTKDVEREEEQPELPMDELPTQKLQREDSQLEDFDNAELPTQALDISELQTQKLDSLEDPKEFDISELATQKLYSLDSSAQNLDIADLPTQRLDIELDSSEPLTQKIDESELPTQKIDDSELPTQKIVETELPAEKIDETELPTQKLDKSELPTQKLDISELDTQQMDMSELPTQKLDASESQKNESDISELQTQRLYSPEAGVPTLYSPDVAIPTLYSPEPEKTEDDGGKTPDVVREWGSKKNEEEEEATTPVENEVATLGDEPEEGIGEKENLDPTTRADRSPETVISIADTTQSSQNDDCEIVEARADEDGESNSYIGKDKRLKIQTGEDQSEIFTQERVDGEEDFPLEKEGHTSQREVPSQETWDSDGGYTPCKDELPLKERRKRTVSPFDESGLEPITPTKDKNDDLDRCRTPAAYAGLGTEAISETDEAMNFEDELTLLSLRKEKEMEEGEILEDGRLVRRAKSKDKDDEGKKKKKKDKKDKTKESEKNKENISSENLVSWKKVSKSNKDRNYREKDRRSRSREKDKDKKKKKEALKKKEKRKELPRYDVRKIVAEKPRPRKDEYGRDIRDLSRSLTRSKSRSRSVSKPRRSVSKARRSRSYSRMRSRSRSRSKRRSWSRDLLRDRASRGRTYSRGRSLSPRRRKSPRRRSVSKKRRSRSLSRRRRSMSIRRRKRSHSRKRRSRSRTRSRDRRKEKKKHKSRSRSRNRKRSRSKSAKRAASRSREKKHAKRKQVSRSRSLERSLSQERDRNRNWEMAEKAISREQHFREREARESWSAQWTPSLSASRSKTPERNELPTRGWSPAHGIDNVTVPPKNLTVILTNKEAIKKKKKEKKKERRKSREEEKRKKTKRNRTPPPSKEVFASGDNILVSVCFNKENESNQMQLPELPETIPLMPPTKRRRREPLQLEPPKKTKKDKAKEKRAKSPKAKKDKKKKSKAAEIAATKKPVAVIDLDQSPFREQTPSPRDVIVLSDDDEKQVQNLIAIEPRQSSQTTPPRDQFVSQGPKTPPEPQVKFSINNKTNLRPSMMNPLLEEEEEEEIDERVEEELEMRAQEELELRLKIGPNTPPEPPSSPPTSPDAYDPFDPTKSRSPTPVQSQEATPLNDERNQRTSPRKHDTADTPLTSNENQHQEQQSSEKLIDKPKIISMVTLKRPSPKRDISPENDSLGDVAIVSESPTKSQQNQQNAQSTATPFPTINPVLATVAAAVQRNMFNANAPATAQRNLLQANRISPPSYQIKQRALERPQLPNLFANSIKTMPLRTSKPAAKSNALSQNGNETEMMNDMIDMSSPYSPGSTLSDGMFEPPSPYNSPPAVISKSKGNKDSKKDAFDTLFGSSPATNRISTKVKVRKDKRKKRVYPLSSATNPKVGVRMDENQLQILDDLPSSAVEMQVKDKFLKKLNRQERVVEEVKLVLKPHYTKKHVTKEEYKDIMRKAVPKICHNRSGEINPKKIGALIEAYVKKCRSNKKKTTTSSKLMKPMKNLWS